QVELYAWAFSLYMVGMLTGSVAAGRIADRRGTLPAMSLAFAVMLIGLLVAGFAPTMLILLIGRLVQGLGGGALNVGLYVVIARAFPEEKRAVMMTAFSACWILPAFIGPPVAAFVATTWSWHWVFLGVVPLLVLAGVLALPPLVRLHAHHEPSTSNPVPVWVGVVLSAAAVAIQYAGQRFAASPDLLVAAAAIAGVVLLWIALPRLMPKGFLTGGRGLPAVMITRALVAGAFFGSEAFLPLMLVETRGQTLTLAGVMLTIGSVGWFIGSWLQSRPWFALGRHTMIVVGAAAACVGIFGCVAVAWWSALWVGVAWLLWPFAGLGMGLLVASTGLAQITLSAPAEQGRNASALTSGESLGNSVVTGVAGTLFAVLHGTAAATTSFGIPLLAMAAIAAIGILTASRIGPIRAAGEVVR
ncbi:MAG: MFS transporter, partial [Propionibacteriaceae bacterium]|nr:MFS transporter [Propionibacteriaceae bacterium]